MVEINTIYQMSRSYQKLFMALTLLLFAIHNMAALAEPIEIDSRPGQVTFSHKTHSSSRCVECHHETTTVNNIISCRQCHNKQSVGKMASKHVFHNNCIDCHAKLKRQKQTTGPVKLCSQCHISKAVQRGNKQKAPD